MNRVDMIESIKMALGYPIVEVELEDIMIDKFISNSLDYIKEYVDTTSYEKVVANSFIPFTKGLVIKVYPSNISISENDYSATNFDETKVNIIRSSGSYSNYSKQVIIQQAQQSQINETISRSFKQTSDGVHLFGYTGIVTLEYESYEVDVNSLSSDWGSWVYKYSLAQSKVTLGRIRSKYKSQSSPFELDGDTLLQEGNEEMRQLEENIYDRGNGLFYVET